MKQQILTVGGDRLGSGEKMKTAINNYNRSTHNLSTKVATSMAPGVLYPISVIPAMRGDSFEFNLNADCRTIPTKGALFGSYKLQVDVFQCPVRLYQAILHNNPQAIGLKMNQVLFPELLLQGLPLSEDNNSCKMSDTALLKYLGLSGLGTPATNEPERAINAIPALAYYDIYKTYYANKQEGKGYIIGTTQTVDTQARIDYVEFAQEVEHHTNYGTARPNFGLVRITAKDTIVYGNLMRLDIYGENLNDNIQISINGTTQTVKEWYENGTIQRYSINKDSTNLYAPFILPELAEDTVMTVAQASGTVTNTNVIKEFDLSWIDEMRYELLSQHQLGVAYQVNEFEHLPYTELFGKTEETEQLLQQFSMAGLALKTYQNDIYNNWLNTNWLEGPNSISEMTSVRIDNNHFSMDSLNFAQKLYNMLNRIVLAGNTYEDWQDVVYEEVKRRQIESPIFCGGMSQEIMFDEVLQTTPTEDSALGTIGGRGRFAEDSNGVIRKGGNIRVKCDEASFIIIMASLTPRVFYTQGNEFYLTDLKSMDDFHKPAMDGIGFQDLVGERMNWKDTVIYSDSIVRHRVGKLPAWINYMTNVDRAYGDFADGDKAYMILNRNYGDNDYTTYIDPSKYNYAFADASITAQNFWLLFGIKIEARRLMSARIIPNV